MRRTKPYPFRYNPATGACWRSLRFKGYRGYRVSTEGEVESRWERYHMGYKKGIGRRLGKTWRRLKPGRMGSGHLLVTLVREGERKSQSIHCLVLEAFVGPRPRKFECCHEDGNPGNNKLSNLRWGTHKSNMADQARHGVLRRGSQHGMAKFVERDIRTIRQLFEEGTSAPDLGRRYNVTKQCIFCIVKRETWKHVK